MRPCIESLQNPKIKHVIRLREARFRRRSGELVIDGMREIGVALRQQLELTTIFCPVDLLESLRAACHPNSPDDLIQPVSAQVFEKIAYGERLQGAVAIARTPELQLEQIRLPTNPLVLILDRAEKPGNIGAVVRTAATAGASAVVLVDPSCEVFNPNAIRASLGTIFSLPIAVTSLNDLEPWLCSQGLQLVRACVDGASSMWDANLSGPIAIALGSEAHGLGPEWARPHWPAIQIPMVAQADSLNLSVSAAVLCYEAIRQRMSKNKQPKTTH